MATEYPGAELIRRGIEDLRSGLETVPSLLVSIGAPRLEANGIGLRDPFPTPELRLYERLRRDDEDSAHARYNALIRRLVSYERALECASARGNGQEAPRRVMEAIWAYFERLQPDLYRYPAIDPPAFERAASRVFRPSG